MPAFLPSELPLRAVARHHWVVLFRLPHRYPGIATVVLLVAAWIRPDPFAWLLGVCLLLTAFLRFRLWRADRIYLTGLRVIEVSGIPETTRSERFLRLDRIAGAEIVESIWGKILGYATIELTAPGDKVDVRTFDKLADPHRFYRILRALSLGDKGEYHPDEDTAVFHPEQLADPDHRDDTPWE